MKNQMQGHGKSVSVPKSDKTSKAVKAKPPTKKAGKVAPKVKSVGDIESFRKKKYGI